MYMQLQPQQKKTDEVPMFTETYNDIKKSLDNAKVLLADANDQWALQPYTVTLQHIRNAATEIMKAFIQTGLGYNANDLTVEGMVKLSENFSTMLHGLFPCNTPEEKHIYMLLTGMDTRNNLLPEALFILFGRVKELKQKVHDYVFKNATLLKY